MKRIILLLVLAVPAIAPASPVEVVSPESVGLSGAQLERLKERLQKELDNEVTGGIQVLIARRGRVVMHENLGHANVEEDKPITDETLFRIYSMTKPVVGTAMMMLYVGRFFDGRSVVHAYPGIRGPAGFHRDR